MKTVDALKKLTKGENLPALLMAESMEEILSGELPSSLAASFLTALRMKGETIEEITAAVNVLKNSGASLTLQNRNVIDIVGTGGDGASTFNISTATAFVVAAGDIKVAKHGNVAATSLSGSADVLKSLGANILLNAKQNEELLSKIGICFMFAPKFLPKMKNVATVRKEIKIRTIFNCLGPLINPSGANFQLIGVYDKKLVLTCIEVMKNLGLKAGMTLFGEIGLDEASSATKTHFAYLNNGKIKTGIISPEDFGLKLASIEDLKGGDANFNAQIIKDIFSNKIKGAKLDTIALNAALAFFMTGRVEKIQDGLNLAYSVVESGLALKKMNEFIEGTNEYIG